MIKLVYSVEIITKEEQRTSTWAGGITTELAIFPKEAEYSLRNFSWRISTARVELDESTFTVLPGIWRYIMVIEGEMQLEHLGHHSINLGPYEKDSFSGSWTTKSIGRVSDFNLMLTNGYNGDIEALSVIDEIIINEKNKYESSEYFTQAIYCTEGKIELEAGGESKIALGEGELAVIKSVSCDREMKVKMINSNCNISRIIRAVIYK